MAELGALSLRIETVGDAAVLRTLDAIDTKARKTDVTLEQTVAALNKLGIAARQVGGSIQVADGQLEQATQIVRRLGSQAQVTAAELGQLGAATSRAAGAATPQLQVFGRDLVQTSGKLTAFGKSGLNAFNALSFGLAQMAATGQTSFRSLATSAASVLAFFGPQGAIAAAVIATGLVLVEFFRRQKKEITELAALAERFRKDAESRRERDQPVTVAEERLAQLRRGIDANRKAMAELFDLEKRTVQLKEATFVRPVDEQALSRLTAERTQLLADELEALRQVNDARAAATKGLETVKVATQSVASIEKERQQAIAAEIGALVSLNKSRGTTAVELLRLIDLEATLTAELASGRLTKEREAEVWDQITKARQTAAQALPRPAVQPLVSGRPQPAERIEMPASLKATLSPEQIAADVAAADRAMAARVAAFNFAETQEALSQSLGNMLASAITLGFAQGLGQGGIGEGFKQMTAQLSMGLGSMAIDYGLKAIAVSKAMASISAWMIANPVAAIAAGIALVALGRSLGGGRGRGGSFGSGGGSFGGTSNPASPISISRLIVDPNATLRQQAASRLGELQPAGATASPTQVLNVIGVNTPRGQELIGVANGRYVKRGG